MYKEFKDALSRGHCSICDRPIASLVLDDPCLHWLLKEKGFRAKYFPILVADQGFRSMNIFLRWAANTEAFGKNINDLVAEKQSKKFIEETIKYKNVEWSFSCSNTDREGHAGSQNGAMPHFHFQMKVDGRVIIKYNAFHIPFTEDDEFSFALEAGRIDRLKAARKYDAGMQTLLEAAVENQEFLDSLSYAKEPADAAFNSDILIMADSGTTISGDDIFKLLERREETGESFARLAKELKNVSVRTITSPSDNVPDISRRSGGRNKKK